MPVSPLRLSAPFFCCHALACLVISCSSKGPAPAAPPATISPEAAAKALNDLYTSYSTGNVEEAQRSLEAANKYIECLNHGKEHALFFLHARMHCLARATNDPDRACIEFAKARYWYLSKAEATTLSRHKTCEQLNKFTEFECDRIVIAYDKANAAKAQAHFWETLPSGPTTAQDWLSGPGKQ